MKAEEQPPADAPEASESPEDEADSEEVTQLSTGETITLRDARAFMDYYCKRFGFGQPEISYETVAMRAGPSKWEAIMEVSMAVFIRHMVLIALQTPGRWQKDWVGRRVDQEDGYPRMLSGRHELSGKVRSGLVARVSRVL